MTVVTRTRTRTRTHTWVVVVMGVSGVGKTTVGAALADALGGRFVDGDALHSAANIEKMTSGAGLDDGDRAPWLAAVKQTIDAAVASGGTLVIACSALRARYRTSLDVPRAGVALVHLVADPAVLSERLAARKEHFAGPALLASQLATLEPPTDAITVDATAPLSAVVAAIVRGLI